MNIDLNERTMRCSHSYCDECETLTLTDAGEFTASPMNPVPTALSRIYLFNNSSLQAR